MNPREFTRERQSEETVINWKIKQFTELLESKSQSPDFDTMTVLEFSNGESLNQSFIWKLELTITSSNKLGLRLNLKESDYESKKIVRATYWVSIKAPDSKLMESMHVSERGYSSYVSAVYPRRVRDFVSLDELNTAGALIHDTLRIQVKLVMYGDETVKETTPATTQKMLKDDSLSDFKKLLETGECSDFVIRVRDLDSNEFIQKKVHRLILSARSPVFKTMLESDMSEKLTGVMTIEDMTHKGLGVFLEFIYSGDLPEAWKLVPEEMVNAAEKYQFPLLKTYIDKSLHTLCTPDNVFTLLKLAKTHDLSKATNNISDYIKSNLDNVLNSI